MTKTARSGPSPRHLPPELRRLVKEVLAELGRFIRGQCGEVEFQRVERLRRRMQRLSRVADAERRYEGLAAEAKRFQTWSPEEQESCARAFALLLELVNACENAYRTWRLRQSRNRLTEPPREAPPGSRIVWVATSHPTEARSTLLVRIMGEIQQLLTAVLGGEAGTDWRADLSHRLQWAWRVSLAPERKPGVLEEAEYLYSLLCEPRQLEALLREGRKSGGVYFRAWVGGDKDGHPGVDAEVMAGSLQLSRRRLLVFFRMVQGRFGRWLERARRNWGEEAWLQEVAAENDAVEAALADLETLREGDGGRVAALRRRLGGLEETWERHWGSPDPDLQLLRETLRSFPALVIPLELRENAAEFARADRGETIAMEGMLRRLGAVAEGAPPNFYAQGLIVSMAHTGPDLEAAARLQKACLGDLYLPVIPLLETGSALERAEEMLRAWMDRAEVAAAAEKFWKNQIEVMVGYSDSAKEMGVLPSRFLIARAVRACDALIRERGRAPVFFHGAGGSVARGGGSLEEQTAWWPRSALRTCKQTVQGEMVQRSMASPEILVSLVEKIRQRQWEGEEGEAADPALQDPVVERFCAEIARHYRRAVESEEFLEAFFAASSYRYLTDLTIGSRPVSRQATRELRNLRAIPWVLAWTQTRVLFPAWWGVGSAWAERPRGEKRKLAGHFARSPLLQAYLKQLGYTLKKTDLALWRLYLEQADLPAARRAAAWQSMEAERVRTLEFFQELQPGQSLVWFRPWLEESIELRSPMIHPLNLAQIEALRRGDARLLRETVTGIACGMLTTG